MEDICRLCAGIKIPDHLISIKDTNLNLFIKIERCCQINLIEDHNLPQNVCKDCSETLNGCWNFSEKVRSAQESLQEMLKANQEKCFEDEVNNKIFEKQLNFAVNENKVKVEHSDSEEFAGDHSVPELCSDNDDEFDHIKVSEGVKNADKDNWKKYPWKCYVCQSLFEGVLALRKHMTDNHVESEIKYECADCSKVFRKYYSFINHVRMRDRTHLFYCCDICYEMCNNSKDLAKHHSSHEDEELQICPVCGKAFKNEAALLRHSKYHQPELKYSCNVCSKTFGTKPNLSAHLKIHAGLKEFVCHHCGKSFVQKANLKEHLLVHENNKPYDCQDCTKSFKTPARLAKHRMVHTDIKPHKCEDCGRTFREKDTLRVHLRIHSGVKPYECEFCGKKFRFRSILTTHRYLHTGARPYSCTQCDHHFTNWPNYNKHMKRVHGVNTSKTSRTPLTGSKDSTTVES